MERCWTPMRSFLDVLLMFVPTARSTLRIRPLHLSIVWDVVDHSTWNVLPAMPKRKWPKWARNWCCVITATRTGRTIPSSRSPSIPFTWGNHPGTSNKASSNSRPPKQYSSWNALTWSSRLWVVTPLRSWKRTVNLPVRYDNRQTIVREESNLMTRVRVLVPAESTSLRNPTMQSRRKIFHL